MDLGYRHMMCMDVEMLSSRLHDATIDFAAEICRPLESAIVAVATVMPLLFMFSTVAIAQFESSLPQFTSRRGNHGG